MGIPKSKKQFGEDNIIFSPSSIFWVQTELLTIVPGVTLIVQIKLIDFCRRTVLKKAVGGNFRFACYLFPAGSRTEYYRILLFYQTVYFYLLLRAFTPTTIWILLRIFARQHLSPCPLWTSHRNIYWWVINNSSLKWSPHLYHFSLPK